jgi:hypothetical protein
MRLRLAFAMLCLATTAGGGTIEEFTLGLGGVDHAVLRMRFEVTFMKIDVADIEVLLTPATAEDVGRIVAADGISKDEKIGRIAEQVLAADTLSVRMTYHRDGDFGRFEKGIRSSLDAALESGSLSTEERDAVWASLSGEFGALENRGVMKGEHLSYRVDDDRLIMVASVPDGSELLRIERTGQEFARWIKGGHFGEKSRFRKKLIESLLDG